MYLKGVAKIARRRHDAAVMCSPRVMMMMLEAVETYLNLYTITESDNFQTLSRSECQR